MKVVDNVKAELEIQNENQTKMEASNIIALALGGISFIISIVGFVLTPILNLKSKKLEKRLDYRFELFQKI